MALTVTTLSAAVTSDAEIFPLTATTSVAIGNIARVDNEFVRVTAISPSIVVKRGIQGSAAVKHQILTEFVFGLPSDFPEGVGQMGYVDPASPWGSATIGADGTVGAGGVIEIPTKDTVITISKATAIALTLTAPSKALNGVKLCFRSNTAAAHVITYTAGFYADTTSSDLATFAAKDGASATFIADNGKWGVFALANVTVA